MPSELLGRKLFGANFSVETSITVLKLRMTSTRHAPGKCKGLGGLCFVFRLSGRGVCGEGFRPCEH